MDVAIRREFHRFEKFLASRTDEKGIASFRDELYNRIQHIADLIEQSDRPEELEAEFFKSFSRFDVSPVHRRARQKPMGYAGDFLLIDWIYTRHTAKDPQGRFFDSLFHSYEAAKSVRNRKRYFIRKCLDLAKSRKSRIDILNIGCGPCRDILETLQALPSNAHVFFHCVDNEQAAIDYAKTLLNGKLDTSRVTLECANCFKLQSDRHYDLIWSAGLFDYLDERIAKILLKRMWRLLKEDGQIIFGNFSPKNPTRRGMELGCHWNLLHRTAGELISLCRETRIPFRELEIESEPLDINLFCIIQK
ncbi:MAG TPA: class I SAM-dependent methyltransferase [bacterium]|nr:class I SAM-dependent methyltransferase [bacterium]